MAMDFFIIDLSLLKQGLVFSAKITKSTVLSCPYIFLLIPYEKTQSVRE